MPRRGAIEAFAYLHDLAAGECLDAEDVNHVRRFFEDLPLQPDARFLAP